MRLDCQTTDIDILKVAHHGSKNSSGDEYLDILKPEYSIISCGKNNIYGHPHIELLSRLKKIHTKIFRTDIRGSIQMRIK